MSASSGPDAEIIPWQRSIPAARQVSNVAARRSGDAGAGITRVTEIGPRSARWRSAPINSGAAAVRLASTIT